MTAPALTIVFPCFNEASRLPGTLQRYFASFPDRDAVEFVIVDDGSTDSTSAIAEKIAAGDPRVRLLRAERNHGKGFAVRTGILAAEGAMVVFTDADGSYGSGDVQRVVQALEHTPVAIGSRAAHMPGRTSPGASLRRAASLVFNSAIRLALGLPFHDTQCGLKGFHVDVARDLFGRGRLDGFAFDAEILFLAHRLGYAVVEVPVEATDRDGSKVRLAIDALRMLADVWSVRRAARRGAYGQARIRDHAG